MENQAKKEVLEKLIALMQQMDVESLRPKPEPQPEMSQDIDPKQPGEPEEAKPMGLDGEQAMEVADGNPAPADDEAEMLERLKEEYAKLC